MNRDFYLIIDTETCNSIDNPLTYNFAGSVIDRHGNTYETGSFINRDIFDGMPELMKSAYYAHKIPQYLEQIANNDITVASWYEIKEWIAEMAKKYPIRAIIAHNARFDYKACNTTQRYETCSKYRYFFPYGVEIWDTLAMAKDTICKQKKYLRFCEENGYLCKNGKPRATAEILYRFITNDTEFVEEHKALEDINIEKEIFWYCTNMKKKMRRKCFKD